MEKCQKILKTVDETKGSLQGACAALTPHFSYSNSCDAHTVPQLMLVLFNYRYNPVHWKVEEVIASGKIGNVKSVHFEWLLVSPLAQN